MAKKPPPASEDKQKLEARAARARWMRELENSASHEKDWRKRAGEVIKRYRDERDAGDESASRFNILYANTEILKGSTYAKPPIPIVRRRWDSQSPVGVIAAKVLERAISYNNECVDLDETLKQCVEDMYLPGRGIARVKYAPTMVEDTQRVEVLEDEAFDKDVMPPQLREGIKQDEKGYFREDTFERVVYEKAPVDYIDWKWFRYSKAPSWKKVRWVAFGDLLTRDDCIRQFGKTIGRKIKLTWKPDPDEDEESDSADARALVWTIWNKPDKSVYVVSEGYEDGILSVASDPLRLEAFFPCPEPLYDIKTNGSLIPIPNFCTYQDQADELDELTQRITALASALKRRGVYDSTMTELEQLSKAQDNQFIPISGLTALREKGGLETVFLSEPIAATSQVLIGLYQQRDQCKSIIYEVTGISDIVRGQSKASETLGAQELKSQYASLRVKQRQSALQRFALQLMRLQGEIISEHFSPETLAAMTGVKLPTNAEKQTAAAQVAQAQATGQQMPPPPIMQMPSWEDVMALIRDDKMRGFNLEIETDSTIAVNEAEEQEAAVKMVAAMGQVGSQIAPAVEGGFIPKEAAKAIVKFAVRKFRASREVEESLDAEVEPQQPQQDPAAMAEVQLKAQQMQADQQAGAAKMQMDAQHQQAQMQMQQQDAAVKMQLEQARMEQDRLLAEQKMQLQLQEAQMKAQLEQAKLAQESAMRQAELEQERELAMAKLRIDAETQMAIEEMRLNAQNQAEIKQVSTMMQDAKASKADTGVMTALTQLMERLTAPKKVTRDASGRVDGLVTKQ